MSGSVVDSVPGSKAEGPGVEPRLGDSFFSIRFGRDTEAAWVPYRDAYRFSLVESLFFQKKKNLRVWSPAKRRGDGLKGRIPLRSGYMQGLNSISTLKYY